MFKYLIVLRDCGFDETPITEVIIRSFLKLIYSIWRTNTQKLLSFTSALDLSHATRVVTVDAIVEVIRHDYIEGRLIESVAATIHVISSELARPFLEVRCDAALDQGTRSPPSYYVVVDLAGPQVENRTSFYHECLDRLVSWNREEAVRSFVGAWKDLVAAGTKGVDTSIPGQISNDFGRIACNEPG